MRKKLFTFLLALVTSVGMSWATVITWDQSKLSSMAMNIESGSGSKASDGIEVTAVSTGEFVRFCYGGAIEIGNGEGSGGGYLTFTSSVGNIAQIDINHSGAGEWRNANGDWISPYYENFEGGIFRWSGTPAASITLTGDAPRHIDDITSIEFTIEDGGGSAQAGLQVTELQVSGSWEDNPTMLSTSDMPGFVAITEAEATAWDAAPAGNVVLIFAFEEGNGATSLSFKNGVYQAAQAHNITYEDLYAWSVLGRQIFYTGGGSTPTPTPAESVTVVFEANNNQKEVEVTLPHTFACDFQNGQGELDGIIQELYALQYGGYCQAFNVPTATGNEAVTASKDGNNHYIAISEAFEGTATVTGNYIKYLDTEHMGNTSVDYTLTISVQGSTLDPEPATGLQVVEVTSDIYDGWNSNSNTFTVDALPGFQAVTFDEAKEWTGVPTSGTAALVYRTNGDYARVIHFFNGTIVDDYDLETSFNQMYENITLFGNRIFYTAGGGSTPTPDPTPTPSGDGDKLAGAFSVGGNKVVYFSKANLQATTADNGATWTWGFAENQWDYVGNSAANNAINGGGTVSTNGPVDLFAWSSTANNYFGINNSINEADYGGDFKDWGAKMGSDWRTLTINEWQYLLQERNPGSSSANHTNYPRYTNAQILTDGTAPQKDIKGIILFPDDFNDGGESIDGVTWGSINPSFYSSYPTTCTTAGWATLESMGCVFLPSAGSRQNFGDEFAIVDVAIMGNYWSSTLYSGEPEDPQSIAVGNGTLGIGTNPRYFGMSVRLVSETAPSGGSANPEIKLYADFSGDWADTEAFTDNGNGTATLTIPSLEAKHNAIFVKKDGVQMSSGHNFTRENPSADVSGNQLAMWFDTDEAGEYTFTFEYSTNILTITYPTQTPTPAPSDDANKLPGAFSVSGTKVVYFSKGNLQATTADNGSTWTWGFAENQYDFIGNAAANNAINGGGTVSTNGAVDLFGWSSTDNNYYGIDNSTNLTDYDGNFQDWGAKVGSDWHALNGAQWEYLLLTREPGSLAGGTSNPRFTRATILTDGTAPSQDIFGLILFPDNFNDGDEYIDGVTWNGINSHSSYVSPTYCTTAGWATLESMGCVFLPAPGWRSGNEVTNVGAFGIYWSSTKYSEEDASCIYFSNTDVAAFHSYITTGASVRLVSETAPSGGSTPANSCGDGLTWELSEGVLTISYDGEGTGEMYDFGYEYDESPVNVAPWKENKSDIATVIVGDGVKSIGNHAFNDLGENFTAVTIANSVERIGLSAFMNAKWVTEMTLPSALQTIDKEGFAANFGLTSITIPSGVTSIGNKAFCYCTALTSLTCEATTPPTLGSSVFSGISGKQNIPLYVPSASVSDYQAASQWNAFNVQAIPGGGSTSASGSCGDGLTWELSEGVLTISYDGVGTGEMYDFDYEYESPVNVAPWKEYKSEITTVVIGDGVKSIGNHAFNDLSENFTAVTIANSVERIGLNAFLNSEEITEITLPSSLKTIDEKGFANCGFSSITIPSGVTSIGYRAFCYCTALTSLTCEATTPPTLDGGVFYKIRSSTSSISSIPLYVPSASVSDYQAASQWNAFNIQGYDPAPTPAYTVAGEPAVAFGTPTWTPTNTDNDMVKQSNGTYKWEKEGVELAKDAVVSFKVCQDHGWDVAYPNDNFNHTILADGIYTLTITFDPNAEGDKVAINAFKTADVVVAQTAEMKGFGDWNTGIALENINEGAAARVTKNLAAGDHEFKMVINDGWRGKVGATITRANNTVAEIVDNPNESNITLTADIPGDYTFTWTYAENTLSVEFPSLVVYVQNLIAAIGEVTLESGDAINAARTAYDNLLDADQKQAVNNYGVLEAAEATYAALAQAAADQLAANNVKNLIDAIDNPVVYTQACKDKIDAARAAYDALTDAQKTLVGVEYAQKLADAEAAYDAFIVYTVAGEPAVAFGTPTWTPTNTDNDMVKQSNGTYKWEKEGVELAKDAVVSFKVCQDHGWDVAYPNDNFNHTILADGIYTLTITFDPNAEGDKVAINAFKTADVVVAQTAEMKGFGDWNTGIALENINEGAAARVTKNLAAGDHEFKMVINDGWRGKVGATITRANNTVAEIVDNPNESNITLTADIPGDYTFTWTYAENTLSVEFPSLVVYVQNLIAAIGEVTLESGDAINAARTAYDNLLDADQKQAVNNYGVLEAAEATYAALAQAAADQLAANNVKNLIDAIDNPVVYTQACKDKIDAARAAYDALTDAQKTLVGVEYAQKLADAEAAYDAFIVYTVAGEPEALFGSFWNIEDTNNDMVKQLNGTYKWEKTDVALAAGIAKFKIIKDHVTYEYPTSNYELNIAEDGIYTVTIIYDPKAAEDRITTNATKTGEAVIVHTAETKGSWNNWTDGLVFENINEGAAARASKILTPGTYEFKMIIDGSWLGEASTTFTRNENAKAEIGGDEDNLKINADIPGSYTFTWTYETNTLEIGYPNYIDANLAIDFRTNPYSVVSGVEQSASVMVEGSMNTGDAAHGYRLPVISIPVTAGNYKVMMGTCSYSNQDATIKTEDNSYTYATLETNNGTCYHQNTATNVVGAIFNVPTDQIIKVYGAEYTPFFSIEKMEAVPAFTDFELNFQTNPYNEISGAKPDGTVIIGTYHDNLHGYQNVEAVVPVEAGNYRLTVGACQYGTPGNVMSETNAELASFNSNLGEGNCYHNNTAANIVSTIFTVDMDQTITINGGAYMPYMKLEKLLDNTYYINFENAEGAIGTVPGEVAIAAGESWTIPANLTLYKEGYTFAGWSDGVNTYAPGDEFFPNAHGTLHAIYTANSVSIADASTINVKWYFGESNGAPSVTWNGVAGYLLAKGEVDGQMIDLKLDIDATSGKFHNAGRGDKWAQVNANTVFAFPSKEGAVVSVETYSGNETYDLAAGTLTCNTNDYYSYLEIVYPAPTTAVVIGDPNDADQVTAFLTTYDGQNVPDLTIDRPVLNNMYNTLCLPFNMDADQIAASSLNGVEIYEFVDVDVTNDELYLYTSEEKHEIVAGRPYLVKFSAASQLDDLNFINVVINNADLDDQAVTIKGVTFKGTFQPIVLGKQTELNFNGGHLFLMANNTLMWPNTDNPLKPFRAYFTVNVDAGQSAGMPVRRGMPAHIGGPAQILTGVENVQGDNVQGTKVVENGVLYIIKNGVKYNAQGQIVK